MQKELFCNLLLQSNQDISLEEDSKESMEEILDKVALTESGSLQVGWGLGSHRTFCLEGETASHIIQ